MILWQQKRISFLLIVSGVCLGISTCILWHKGILLLCAILAWILVRRRQEPRWLHAATFVITSYLAVVGVTQLYFYLGDAHSARTSQSFTASLQNYESINSVTYAHGLFGDGVFDFWSALFRHTTWGTALSVGLILPDLLIASLPLTVLLLSIRYRSKTGNPEILLLWLAGYALLLSEFQRTDMTHLIWGSPILIILFAHLLGKDRTAFGRGAGSLVNIAAVFLALCTILVVTLGAKTVVTRRGSITVLDQNAPEVLGFLDREVKPGEEIFVYPYSPLYYFLSGASDATRYSFLIYGFIRQSSFKRSRMFWMKSKFEL